MANPQESITSVRRFFDSFALAYESADLDAITGNVTEDLRLYSATESTVAGKPAFNDLVSTILKGFTITDFRISIEDLVITGEHAFVLATYTWTLTKNENGSAEQLPGRFAMLLQNYGGSDRWRVQREVSF